MESNGGFGNEDRLMVCCRLKILLTGGDKVDQILTDSGLEGDIFIQRVIFFCVKFESVVIS